MFRTCIFQLKDRTKNIFDLPTAPIFLTANDLRKLATWLGEVRMPFCPNAEGSIDHTNRHQILDMSPGPLGISVRRTRVHSILQRHKFILILKLSSICDNPYFNFPLTSIIRHFNARHLNLSIYERLYVIARKYTQNVDLYQNHNFFVMHMVMPYSEDH